MVKIPKEISELIEGKTVFFATASSLAEPNLVCVEINKVFEDKILITNNMLGKTETNLAQNKKSSISFYYSRKAFQLKGVIESFSSGKWFDSVKSLPGNSKYSPKAALLFSVKEIWDLDSGKRFV